MRITMRNSTMQHSHVSLDNNNSLDNNGPSHASTDAVHVPTPTQLRTNDAFDLATDLVATPSVSFNEQFITELIEEQLNRASHLQITRIGDNLIARTNLGRKYRLVLAGHTDTVPPSNNKSVPPSNTSNTEKCLARVYGDNMLAGLGATDMKGGLAVVLFTALTVTEPAIDVTYVFYAREEVASVHNGLKEIFQVNRDILAGDAAILMEPTNTAIEAGCQGTMRIKVTLSGRRAHTARAWMGHNAIHRLRAVLDVLDGYEPRKVLISKCEFHEGLQAVNVSGGIAGNVVPDKSTITINHRFAPDRTVKQAEQHVRNVIEPVLGLEDTLEVLDVAPAADPGLDHPMLEFLARNTEVRAKLGWTDVAFFSEQGIPASNFGPSDPLLAHTENEHVYRSDIDKVCHKISALLHNETLAQTLAQ